MFEALQMTRLSPAASRVHPARPGTPAGATRPPTRDLKEDKKKAAAAPAAKGKGGKADALPDIAEPPERLLLEWTRWVIPAGGHYDLVVQFQSEEVRWGAGWVCMPWWW